MATPESAWSVSSLIPIGMPVFTGVLGVVGGYWLRAFENRKSEILKRSDDLADLASNLHSNVITYWAQDREAHPDRDQDRLNEGMISSDFHKLNVNLNELCLYFPQPTALELKGCLRAFKQDATGGDFASNPARKPSSPAISNCIQSSAEFEARLRNASRAYNQRLFRVGRRRN